MISKPDMKESSIVPYAVEVYIVHSASFIAPYYLAVQSRLVSVQRRGSSQTDA